MIIKAICYLFHSLLINVLKSQRTQLNQDLYILNAHPAYVGRSKKQAFQEMLLCMKKGLNVCIFPESTWNITPL